MENNIANDIPQEIHEKPAAAVYSMWLICLVGAGLGLAYWALAQILSSFMIEPIFCHSANSVTTCLQATEISGAIASIFVTALAVVVMISLKMVRPLIIALSSTIVLWGLAGWTSGLGWFESVLWSIFLYAVSYVLFSWIARYLLIRPVIISMLVIIIIARIAIAL